MRVRRLIIAGGARVHDVHYRVKVEKIHLYLYVTLVAQTQIYIYI